jgi:formylmethanofuran dehydrogenase subunit C
MVTFALRSASAIPIEVEGLLPLRLVGLTLDAIRALPVVRGNRTVTAGELFDVTTSEADDGTVRFTGSTASLKRIGERMTAGTIVVAGDAGMHAGAYLAGGTLKIRGNAGDWLGAEMAGGAIVVAGDAGDGAGAGYRGCRRGMTGGTIAIHGNAGAELGAHLRRGTIVVHGDAGDYCGVNLIAGTIAVRGGVGRHAGVGMKRGTLLLGRPPEPHPGLVRACTGRPAYLRYLERDLAWPAAAEYQLWRGDRTAGGQGELWCPTDPG